MTTNLRGRGLAAEELRLPLSLEDVSLVAFTFDIEDRQDLAPPGSWALDQDEPGNGDAELVLTEEKVYLDSLFRALLAERFFVTLPGVVPNGSGGFLVSVPLVNQREQRFGQKRAEERQVKVIQRLFQGYSWDIQVYYSRSLTTLIIGARRIEWYGAAEKTINFDV